jgi:opacity protein-like surface antigen
MKLKWIPLVVCLLGAVAVADVSAGQAPGPNEPDSARTRRPYRGIFAPPADPSSKQSLNLTGSVFGAYDDDVYGGDSAGGAASDFARRGTFAGAAAGIAYEKRGDRFSGGLSSQAGVNQHFDNTFGLTDYYGAGGAFSGGLSRSTRIAASENITYSPQYLLGPLQPTVGPVEVGDQLIPTQIDLGLFRQRVYLSSTAVQLTYDIGRRSSVDASYGLGLVHYTESGGRPDYRVDAARAGFHRQLTRHATLRAGYGYQTAGHASASPSTQTRLHTVDLGIDYERALSVSRRTHFRFSTGSAIWAHDDPQASNARDLSLRLTGNARLDHEIGRTWTAQLAYDRGLAFYEGFADPFLTDGVTADINGFLARRVRFSSAGSYSFGTVGAGNNRGFSLVSANAGLEYALTHTLALFTRYVYYRYDFDANVSVDPRLLRKFDRQGIRAGLAVFIPVIR